MKVPDYKSMYFSLAAKVATAIELLHDSQLQGEDAYIDGEPQCLTMAVREDGAGSDGA